MGTKIVKKDISWLIEKAPDVMDFIDSQSHYFSNGGYLAGGFLRRIINKGNVIELLEEPESDIDFFFYNQKACEDAFTWFQQSGAYIVPNTTTHGNILTPNSMTGFAFEGHRGVKLKNSPKFTARQKFQFIYKSYGTPEEVLNRFDLANSKIATDGKNVWMVEDWEELENKKIVRVDNLAGKYLASRLSKYIGKEYCLFEGNYGEVLIKILEIANEKKSMGILRRLVRNKKVIKDSDVTLFYDLLGETWENASEQDYQNGTLGQTEDFAAHVFRERLQEANV